MHALHGNGGRDGGEEGGTAEEAQAAAAADADADAGRGWQRRARAEWVSEDGGWVVREYAPSALMGMSTPPIGRGALRDMATSGATVKLVWQRHGGRERPWVMVCPSATLQINGVGDGADPGLGLYAWRGFERDELIGRYTGESLGTFAADDREGVRDAVLALPAGQQGKVVEFERPRNRVELLDAEHAGAPYLQRANDARGMTDSNGKQLRNTAFMTGDGQLLSMRRTHHRGVGAKWRGVPPPE